MSSNKSAASKDAAPAVFRMPAWARWFSLVGTLVLAVVTVMMLVAAIFLLFKQAWGVAALVAAASRP